MQAGSSPEDNGIRSTLVSPAGSGGLHARLVRAASDAATPFVIVHQGRFAKILLAELVSADGVALTQFAWKMRVDSVAPDVAVGRQAPCNAELDCVWHQEVLKAPKDDAKTKKDKVIRALDKFPKKKVRTKAKDWRTRVPAPPWQKSTQSSRMATRVMPSATCVAWPT